MFETILTPGRRKCAAPVTIVCCYAGSGSGLGQSAVYEGVPARVCHIVARLFYDRVRFSGGGTARPRDFADFGADGALFPLSAAIGGPVVGAAAACTRPVQSEYKASTERVQGGYTRRYRASTRRVQSVYTACTRLVQSVYTACTRLPQSVGRGIVARIGPGCSPLGLIGSSTRRSVAILSRRGFKVGPIRIRHLAIPRIFSKLADCLVGEIRVREQRVHQDRRRA